MRCRRPSPSPWAGGPRRRTAQPGRLDDHDRRHHAIDRLRRESRGRELRGEVAVVLPGGGDPGTRGGAVADDRLRRIFTCCHPALSTQRRWGCPGPARWPVNQAGRPLLSGARGDHGDPSGGRLAQDQGGADPLPGARGPRAARPPPSRAGRRLPRRQPRADRVRSRVADRGRRFPGAAGRAGPHPMGPGPDRRGPGDPPPLPWPQPPWSLSAPGGHQRRARGRPTVEQTDWRQIVALYDRLLVVAPTPVVVLNRAIAIGELHGPAVALALVEGWRIWTAPTHSTPPGPTCLGGWAGTARPPPPPSAGPWRRPRPSGSSSEWVAAPRATRPGDVEHVAGAPLKEVSGRPTRRRFGPPATRLGPGPSPCAAPRRRRTARPGRSGRRGSPGSPRR